MHQMHSARVIRRFTGLIVALTLAGCPDPVQVARASPAAASPPTQLALQDDSYLLGPGDRLELKLFDAPELSGQIDVLNDGTASLPLLGSVRLTGLSISQ
ncbi:MAG: polysaccharide biosynthesis/export family protein, partial [Cyanobacteriota bacterium]|nr:polysaccharide biosynthesis/export family protein [Cyanobacteriota bacterium]